MRNTLSFILTTLMLSGAALAQSPPTSPQRPSAPAQAQTSQATPAAPSSSANANAATQAAITAAEGFTVGDVVELKSGSPHMTVIEVGPNDVQVLWYTNDKGLQRERFPTAALEKTDLNEPDEFASGRGQGQQQADHSRRDEGMSRGLDRGADRDANRDSDRSMDRQSDRELDRNAEDFRMIMRWHHEMMRRDREAMRDRNWRGRRYHDDDDDRYERRSERRYDRR
jgi:uncharacterized protein YodC (DUF2158 family)